MRADISPSVWNIVKIMKTLAFAKKKKKKNGESMPGRQIEYYERNDQNCMVAFILEANILSFVNRKF